MAAHEPDRAPRQRPTPGQSHQRSRRPWCRSRRETNQAPRAHLGFGIAFPLLARAAVWWGADGGHAGDDGPAECDPTLPPQLEQALPASAVLSLVDQQLCGQTSSIRGFQDVQAASVKTSHRFLSVTPHAGRTMSNRLVPDRWIPHRRPSTGAMTNRNSAERFAPGRSTSVPQHEP